MNALFVRRIAARTAVVATVACAAAFADAPALKPDQISLDGIWDFTPNGGTKTTMQVPEPWDRYAGVTAHQASYERQVAVPSSFAGKTIQVEFETVNHIADVYVNETLVGTHVGGFIPFSYDITNLVAAGSSFDLRVDVKDGTFTPIVNANNYPMWPVGWYGGLGVSENRGIICDMWLRAYGKTCIQDSYIKTSYRNHTLSVDYTVKNSDAVPHTVTIEADAVSGTTVEKNVTSSPVTLAAGETRVVGVSTSWTDPNLWMPGSPALYNLNSIVREAGSVLDQETRRFGFREIWMSGNKYLLNGIPTNMCGDNVTYQSIQYSTTWYQQTMSSDWPAMLDSLMGFNMRVLRFHMNPVNNYALDICDEKGILVVDESAIFAQTGWMSTSNSSATFCANADQWIGPWVRGQRNHPSVIVWSAENEMGAGANYLDWLSDAQLRALGDTIRNYDKTRPIIYEGDHTVPDSTSTYHYPEGFRVIPTAPIYNKWSNLISANQVTCVGEYLSSPGTDDLNSDYYWWQGTMARSLRYAGVADIRPWTRSWFMVNPSAPPVGNLRNSFAAVALFDSAYDDLGIDPIKNANFPSLDEGVNVGRKLILYNDEYAGSTVTLQIQVKSGSTVYATGTGTIDLTLGTHMNIPYAFQVPYVGGSTIDVVLTTLKAGVRKFQETRTFKVANLGTSGTSSSVVTIQGATQAQCIPSAQIEKSSLQTSAGSLVAKGNGSLRIMSLAGRAVETRLVRGFAKINPGELPAGLYLVTFSDGSRILRTTVVRP